ncbi:hypothetical protein [Archangium violaceum]|nr:hypothetical protein [Archangium violaceum]
MSEPARVRRPPGPRPRMLRGKVDWSQQAEAMRLLADWPRR